jgi:hypothetical protein
VAEFDTQGGPLKRQTAMSILGISSESFEFLDTERKILLKPFSPLMGLGFRGEENNHCLASGIGHN